jgi:sodium transport system permease protein
MMLRDRRTLFMMIVLPVLLYPMMIIAFSWFAESQSEAREERASTVAVWGAPPDDLVSRLRQNDKLALRPWAGASPEVKQGLSSGTLQAPPVPPSRGQEEGRASRAGTFEAENPVLASARPLITGGQVDAVLVFWPGFDRAIADCGLGQVSVYFDSVRLDSTKALERLNDALAEYRTRLIREREEGHGLAAGFSRRSTSPATWQRAAPVAELLGSVLQTISSYIDARRLLPGHRPDGRRKERGTMRR